MNIIEVVFQDLEHEEEFSLFHQNCYWHLKRYGELPIPDPHMQYPESDCPEEYRGELCDHCHKPLFKNFHRQKASNPELKVTIQEILDAKKKRLKLV